MKNLKKGQRYIYQCKGFWYILEITELIQNLYCYGKILKISEINFNKRNQNYFSLLQKRFKKNLMYNLRSPCYKLLKNQERKNEKAITKKR